MKPEQSWELPDEDCGVLAEDWVDSEAEGDGGFQDWAGYDDELAGLDSGQGWEVSEDGWEGLNGRDLYVDAYAPLPRARLGLGFVMTCALIVGVALALVLYQVTAGATFPALSAPSAGGEAQASEILQAPADEAGPVLDGSGAVAGECAVSERYPAAILQWCNLITHYANKHGLPPDLVASLIWQESGGNAAAYSRSGAVGLMQVMPRDGLAASFMCNNGPCFSTRPSTEQLKDPEFNIAYGTKMLAGLMARSGSFREALRSYGPMNVGYYYADKVLGLFQTYGKQSP
jgi:hypothetical protein